MRKLTNERIKKNNRIEGCSEVVMKKIEIREGTRERKREREEERESEGK